MGGVSVMLTNKEIGVLCYCRGCLNRKCGQQEKHVVFSIKPLSRWKLLKGHSPRYSRK